MPAKSTKKAKTPADNVVEMAGYRRRPVYAWREYAQPDDAGEEIAGDPLKVKVQVNLTVGEREDMTMSSDTTFDEAFELISPYVADWNLEVPDPKTGEPVKLPPPAEAGPEVLKALDELEALWLIAAVRGGRAFGRRDEDEKKDSTTSEPSDTP